KLRDLALIEREYRAAIEGRFVDSEDCLIRLARRIGESQWLRGAEVWVDGFADFTPRERDALLALMRAARSTEVALLMDPDDLAPAESGEERLRRSQAGKPAPRATPSIRSFAVCEKTRAQLRRAALEAGIHVAPDLLLKPERSTTRFKDSPALALLEEKFFQRNPRPCECPTWLGSRHSA
ncbi:MAG: hypothetical protein NTW86_22705, partial [Candidatus Sumerlaeota bacterium]|nr:hypothetical protein [Candidatus Sumerlaeota bacterium]